MNEDKKLLNNISDLLTNKGVCDCCKIRIIDRMIIDYFDSGAGGKSKCANYMWCKLIESDDDFGYRTYYELEFIINRNASLENENNGGE